MERPELIPPHDLDAEYSVLSGLLLDNKMFPVVEELLQPSDFYNIANAAIYESMRYILASGDTLDVLTLADRMEKEDKLKVIGGKITLLDLASYSVYAMTEKAIRGKAQIVREKSLYRSMIRVGTGLVSTGYEADDDTIEDAVSSAVSQVMALALSHTTASVPIGVALDTLMSDIRSGKHNYIVPPGLPFARLNPGDLVVVSAGTSVGKTALTLNWADEWSKKKSVVYFEYEMPESSLMARLVCKYSGVTYQNLTDGVFTPEEESRVNDSIDLLKSRKLKVEEVWCDIGTLMSKIRREASNGAEVIVIDHLGLIPYNMPKGLNSAKAIGKMLTNPLKNLASELNIIIVVLVQLNREGQKEEFPKLYHLRDSGEIEQDASVVVMLWSERVLIGNDAKRIAIREQSGILDENECKDFGDTVLIRAGIEKNRNGIVGHRFLLYHGDTFTYEDRSEDSEPAWKSGNLF